MRQTPTKSRRVESSLWLVNRWPSRKEACINSCWRPGPPMDEHRTSCPNLNRRAADYCRAERQVVVKCDGLEYGNGRECTIDERKALRYAVLRVLCTIRFCANEI